MAETKVFDLNQLAGRIAGRIRVGDVEHDVLQINGGTYEAVQSAPPREAVSRTFAAIPEICPSLDPAIVERLNVDQAVAILQVSMNGVAFVEAMFPPDPPKGSEAGSISSASGPGTSSPTS